MKKILLAVAAVSVILGFILFDSCSKVSTSPPIITLLGPNPYNVTLNSAYTDPGETAVDNEGNSLTSSIFNNITSKNPNMNLAGTYTIWYTVYDVSGFKYTINRTVNVVNSAAYLAGNYSVSDTRTGNDNVSLTYITTISQSFTQNNVIYINNFGNFGAPVQVSALVNGNALIIAPQSPSGINPAPVINGLQGSGSVNSTSIVGINYSVDWGGSPDAAVSDFAVYTKM